MASEIRVMHQNDTTVQAKVVSGLVFCHDTQDFRGKVLLSTQGGRKTSAARILKKNGRLWSMPIPDGYELAMFTPDAPAIFCVPGDTTNLADCTRLKLYRKCLMTDQAGVTFDLTQTKDCVCALPYRTFGDVSWHFLVALRGEGNLHWFITKETFNLVNDESKPTRRRRRTSTAKATQQGDTTAHAQSAPTTPAVKQEEVTCAQPFQPQPQQQHEGLQVGSFVYHRQSPSGPIGTVMEIDLAGGLAVVSWSTGSQIIYHLVDLVPARPATQPPAPTPQMVAQPQQQQQQQQQPMHMDLFPTATDMGQFDGMGTNFLPSPNPEPSAMWQTQQQQQPQSQPQPQPMFSGAGYQQQPQQHFASPTADAHHQHPHQFQQGQAPFQAHPSSSMFADDPFADLNMDDEPFIPAYGDQPDVGFSMGTDMDVDMPMDSSFAH